MEIIDKMLNQIAISKNMGNYVEEARKRGIKYPQRIGYDLFNYYNKYHYSFDQVCAIWEKYGYIIWAGELPIYVTGREKCYLPERITAIMWSAKNIN